MLPWRLPESARHSTTRAEALYLGTWGRILGEPRSRGWVRQTVRQGLKVARTPPEIRRVMDTWRHVHYLGRGGGNRYDPIGRGQIRLHYFMDLPVLRCPPVPWIPAAAVTVRHVCAVNGVPPALGLESPMEALEIARSFVADDLRWPHVADLSPAVLREVVRRLREGTDWQREVAGRVKRRPTWLLTYADPAVGHDGGLYRGAGAVFLGESAGGKLLFGWPLVELQKGA